MALAAALLLDPPNEGDLRAGPVDHLYGERPLRATRRRRDGMPLPSCVRVLQVPLCVAGKVPPRPVTSHAVVFAVLPGCTVHVPLCVAATVPETGSVVPPTTPCTEMTSLGACPPCRGFGCFAAVAAR